MAKHEAVTTQSQHPWRATVRTVLAIVVALAAMAPAVYSAATLQNPELATGAAAATLAIAAAITRIMALPAVEAFLQRFIPWLAAGRHYERDVPDGKPLNGADINNVEFGSWTVSHDASGKAISNVPPSFSENAQNLKRSDDEQL